MAKELATDVQMWFDHIAAYDREFKKWEGRSEKIVKRYRDETRSKTTNSETKFNILWSNVQTLTAATFSKVPKPDVSRRFKDQDPVGRIASLILERALDYEISKYTDYVATLKSAIYDRFLGGRGTAWVRYEPHFRAAKANLPEDGSQVTEDIDEPNEVLDYECAPTDYVHWRDFGHAIARTWEEVPAVWRVVYLTRGQCIERFGEDLGKKIPLDSKPDDWKDKNSSSDAGDLKSRAKIYEIWDKTEKKAIWLSKTMRQIVDEREDPLGLDSFFPCPKPLFATLTNDSLVPVPDFTLYQDQANSLDILADRIDGLIKGLKIAGGYDAANPELQRIFTEAGNNELIPVKNWTALVEKGGLKSAVDIVDITPLALALKEAYTAADQIKSQIYEITGISDIIRGQTEASETATAQQIKGQYASLRLKSYQEEVGRFATELLQIKAQIICGKFSPQTIVQISAAQQLSQQDQQILPQALALLVGPERMQNPEAEPGPNPMRQFRIEVAADSLVYMDEQAEKQGRMEFLTATSQFLDKAVPAAQTAPEIVPLLMDMLKFGVTGFKVGKTIEGSFDETADKLKQAAANPQPKPDPEMAKVQAQQQMDQLKLQHEGQLKQMDMQMEQNRLQMEAQARDKEQQIQAAIEQHRNELEAQRENLRVQHEGQLKQMQMQFDKWKAELDAQTRIAVAEISAKATLDAAQLRSAKAEATGGEVQEATQ